MVNEIPTQESTVLFVGYQTMGTLGRQIVDGAKEVRILRQMRPVRARAVKIHSFSAHADRDELFRRVFGLRKPLRGLIATHGEPDIA